MKNRHAFVLFFGLCSALTACDRLEGKAKDAAGNVAVRLKETSRSLMVSDLQRAAEGLCGDGLSSYVRGSAKYALYDTTSVLSPKSDVFEVIVNGDGKYLLKTTFYGSRGGVRPIAGSCVVEGGALVSVALDEPQVIDCKSGSVFDQIECLKK